MSFLHVKKKSGEFYVKYSVRTPFFRSSTSVQISNTKRKIIMFLCKDFNKLSLSR